MRPKPRQAIALSAGLLTAGSLGFVALNGQKAQAVDTSLDYSCQFPSGAHDVSVGIKAAFPEASAVGEPAQPSAVTLTVGLPTADLSAVGASKVSGTAQLATDVVQNGSKTQSVWSGLAVPPTQVSGQQPLTLQVSGAPPEKKLTSAGEASFSAGELTLALTPTKADGKATNPASLTISCSPRPGQKTLLATVPVAGPTDSPPPQPVACDAMQPPSSAWNPACTYATGYANVAKLGSAIALNDPGFQDPVPISAVYQFVPNTRLKKMSVLFKLQNPLRSRATFLTFNFMPVTATMELVQEPSTNPGGPEPGWGAMDYTDPTISKQPGAAVHVTMMVSIHLSDVTVNGTSLDVGDKCATSPTLIALSDVPGHPIGLGGTTLLSDPAKFLAGWYDIPPFHDCRSATEDVTPLFNASVSGPKNYLAMTLGTMDQDPSVVNIPWPPIRH